jgi:hypothetical protein
MLTEGLMDISSWKLHNLQISFPWLPSNDMLLPSFRKLKSGAYQHITSLLWIYFLISEWRKHFPPLTVSGALMQTFW